MVAIDNVDALQTWLTKKLSPVCDADPKALAKYVVALVKKEKSQDDLKTLCKEQLDVFLQKETDAFVSALFEALTSKSYIKEESITNVQTEVHRKSSSNDKQKENSRSHRTKSRSRSPHRVRSQDGRRYNDDRRNRRRSPMASHRHQSNRRQRSRSSSPIARSSRSSVSPVHKRRSHRSSPRQSRSPIRRKRIRKSSSPAQASENSQSKDGNQKSYSSETKEKKERCWDYDQKGFCMKGDSCPYDHGTDAVVVDDISITSPTRKNANEATNIDTRLPPPIAHTNIEPLQHLIPRLPISMPMPIPPVMPPMSLPPPHILHQFPPPPLNLRPSNPNIMPPQPQPYNPEAPALHGIQNQQNPAINISNTFQKKPDQDNDSMKRPFHRTAGNRTIIVKKIPPSLNNITKLNEHFTKFGSINNIQVKFNMQPNQALIEFAHPNSARAAMRDTDAILNNRFIRAFWFNQNEIQTANNEASATSTIKDRVGSLPNPNQLKYTAPSIERKKANADVNVTRTITNPLAPPAAEKTDKPNTDAATVEAKKAVIAARNSMRQKSQQRQRLVLQKKMELQKKKRGLLQKQVEQQKLLLAKLDSNKNMSPKERLELIKTLKALTSSTDIIRHEKPSKVEVAIKQSQKQKDLLDAELDLYNASTNGENTVSLKQKLNQLKVEAKTMGIVTGYRGGWSRGRGGSRMSSRGNHHRFIRSGANLDRRPCEIRVSGFQDTEKDEMIAHFSEFGEIDTLTYDEEGITCAIKYKARQDAEHAASNGASFKGRNLIIVWTSQSKPNQRDFTASSDNGGSVEKVEATIKSEVGVAAGNDEDDNDDDDEDNISVVVDRVEPFTPPQDDYGYPILEEELDEEALLTGGDIDDDDDVVSEERSWRH
uniref:Zinc finger protein n=1 Tax=Ciona intestinalis TaxID=7719 RepID=Q1RPZ0_CIOIN|nr:zinc finger protein [Ciona intestinalis]BAE93295.1 zinc finger protein [Ciona intestinalis]|eukprot:NP_001071908.1 zinc finger protein [Ciona intestinalis]